MKTWIDRFTVFRYFLWFWIGVFSRKSSILWSRYSSFDIVTDDGWIVWVRFPAGAKYFPVLHSVQTDSGAHPASHPMGLETLSPGVKRSSLEADCSPQSSSEVKNNGAILPLPDTSSCFFFLPSMLRAAWIWSPHMVKGELLYDGRFTANQFVLAPSPFRLTTSIFFLPPEHLRL
jgi:hypothetical protein